MTTVTDVFEAKGASSVISCRKDTQLSWTVEGTWVATWHLQHRINADTWETVLTFRANSEGSITVPADGDYRLFCSAFTSGSVEYSFEDDNVVVLAEWRDRGGNVVLRVTEAGVELGPNAYALPGLGADNEWEGTNVFEAIAVESLTEAVEGEGIRLGATLRVAQADEEGVSAISLGSNATTGLQVKVLEEVVVLTDAGAKFVAMTTPIPAGAVILSVQANIDVLAVAGGTSVKVGLGLNATDVNKYGITSALTKNLKINTIPDWAVLSAPETIDVCAAVTDGSDVGDSNFSAGSVRVRIVYLEPVGLTDA
jgi:hypothetical protein